MSAIDESSKREEEVMSFVASLESRLTERSDRLEDEHLEAAINAQIAEIDGNDGKCNNASSHSVMSKCYSPFVPSPAERIAAFFHFSGLTSIATTHQTDVLLDIGCGDGRVCIAAASLRSSLTCLKKVIGVDISPSCIAQACHVAYNEQNLTMDQCQFYDRDMTSDPLKLLEESSALSKELRSVTVVYLFAFPTLLIRLMPLLIRLFDLGRLRAVVTLTYHLPDDSNFVYTVEKVDEENDFKMYSSVQMNN